MSLKTILADVKIYGKNWLIIFIPIFLSLIIIFATSEIDSYSKVFLKISDLSTSLFLSVSAAGIFHLLIVFLPERDKNRKSLRLLKDHLIVLDKILLELLNKIDPKLISIESLDKEETDFFSLIGKFNYNKKIYIINPQPNPFPFNGGKFLDIFSCSLGRFELIKEIFIYNTQLFDSNIIQYITNAIWNYNYLRKEELTRDDIQECFLKTLEFYNKTRKQIIKLSKDHGI